MTIINTAPSKGVALSLRHASLFVLLSADYPVNTVDRSLAAEDIDCVLI